VTSPNCPGPAALPQLPGSGRLNAHRAGETGCEDSSLERRAGGPRAQGYERLEMGGSRPKNPIHTATYMEEMNSKHVNVLVRAGGAGCEDSSLEWRAGGSRAPGYAPASHAIESQVH
jgi:hypothetical protein